MLFDSKWVAVARHGLILWENEATGLKNLLKYLLDLGIYFLILNLGVGGMSEALK